MGVKKVARSFCIESTIQLVHSQSAQCYAHNNCHTQYYMGRQCPNTAEAAEAAAVEKEEAAGAAVEKEEAARAAVEKEEAAGAAVKKVLAL